MTLHRRFINTLLLAIVVFPLAAQGDDILPFTDMKLAEPRAHFSATQECVEPEEDMKRNHMEYILHQRDETMYDGIRTRQYALEECINCHASKDENDEYIRIEDSRHFCASCHVYTATKIDCFQCHADVPVRSSNMHSLQSETSAHHKQALKQAPLTSETLQLITAETKPQ